MLAHGVKKMNSINRFLSQNGTLVKLSTTNSKFPSLKEGEIIDEYENIKKNVDTYTYMNHIMELVRNVISEDLNHVKMFGFLEKIFRKINSGDDYEVVTFSFELKLLHFIGYGLNFKECNICGNSNDLVFNVSNGGLICKEHLNYNDLSYDVDIYNYLKFLYYIDLDKHDLPEITNPERVIIRNIIDMLFDEFVSFKTKSRKIIKQIKKY